MHVMLQEIENEAQITGISLVKLASNWDEIKLSHQKRIRKRQPKLVLTQLRCSTSRSKKMPLRKWRWQQRIRMCNWITRQIEIQGRLTRRSTLERTRSESAGVKSTAAVKSSRSSLGPIFCEFSKEALAESEGKKINEYRKQEDYKFNDKRIESRDGPDPDIELAHFED